MTDSLTATLQTNYGPVVVRLFPDHAPKTVRNFTELAEGSREWSDPRTGRPTNDPLYNQTIFHRVIEGFMIQGGDPTGTGRGGPGYQFDDEPVKRRYERGILAMANAGPNTNGSQFFVMHADQGLPPNYTIFGKLVEGEPALDAIATARTDVQDRPQQPTTIERVEIKEG